MQECTSFHFTGKRQRTITKFYGKHVIKNLSLSFVVIALEHVGTQSVQGMLAREHTDMQDTLACKHMRTQGMLVCEHVRMQSTLAHELVSTQGMLARKHARHAGT